MGIYLPNMEMPRKGQMLVIFPDGTSYVCFNGMRERLTQTTAVPVPPHGRLIDADALTEKLKKHREYHSDGSNSGAAISNGIGQCLDIINGRECPTIIEAEEGE